MRTVIYNSQSLQSEIASLLLEKLKVEVTSVDEDLVKTGLLDSLKIVELLVELELRFEMRIPPNELEIEMFRSVATMAAFVANHNGSETPSIAAASASPRRDNRPPVAE